MALSVLAALGPAACTTYTGPVGNPVERSLTWFSYVAGDDIRAACGPGARDRFRFVYNAVYERQIRAYDLRMRPGGAAFTARARNAPGEVGNFRLRNPLGPWELRRSEATLTDGEAAAVVEALARDAAAAPPAAGRRLRSNEFYWVVAACSAGRFRLLAFDQRAADPEALAFPGLLLALDKTGVGFKNAERVEGFARNAFEIRINAAGDGIVDAL